MKTNYLFPNYCKIIGKIITVPSIILGVFLLLFLNNTLEDKLDLTDWLGGYIDEVALIGCITGLLLVAFSKEKLDDEYIDKIRSSSLVFAVLANYIIIIIGTCLFYSFTYITFVLANSITILLIYVLKFNFTLYRLNKSCKDEK